MTAGWDTLKALFDELSELPESTREIRLASLNDDDPELADRLRQLLDAGDDDDHVLTQAVRSVASDALQEHRRIGDRLGAYTITGFIARGGMGEVFAAERSDGSFEQRVAIKLIHAGLLDADGERRFAAERRILARLDHPGIGRILDGGNTEDGAPYLVMEFVEGRPVHRYCNEQQLDLAARLSLFRKICDAVDYAHRNLVVHRDLKPSNILVTDSGQPVLLDFGIAKLLDDSPEAGDVTELSARAMTPDFASPEQVLGRPVTTVSDVYSLGVLLYLLVCGEQPYVTAGLRASERERLLCDTEPARPSASLTSASHEERVAGATPAVLRGDLDTIVLTAMHKDPARRYDSPRALSQDLGAYLSGRPVMARGRTMGYVFGKFLRRNAWQAAAAGALLLSGVAATVYHTETITAERDRAETEAARSAAVVEFMVEIFDLQTPQQLGADITAKQVLDTGADRLKNRLDEQPLTRAALTTTIANVYHNLGFYDESIRQHDAARALFESAGDPVGALNNQLAIARARVGRGEFSDGISAYERAIAVMQEVYPSDDATAARYLSDFGHALHLDGQYPRAQARYEQAIAMLQRLGDTEHDTYEKLGHNLGQVLHLQGKLADAEPLLRVALEDARRRYGNDSAETSTRLSGLATLLQEREAFDEAEVLMLEGLDISIRTLGDEHPDHDVVMTNLGRLYRQMGRLDEAESWLQRAVEHSIRTRGREHAYTAYDMNNLAKLYVEQGEYDVAEPMYREIIDIYTVTVGTEHPYVASASVAFADLLRRMDRPADAKPIAQQAYSVSRATLPDGHWLTYQSMVQLGSAELASGAVEAGGELLLAAYQGLSGEYPERGGDVRNAAIRLAEYYDVAGMADSAADLREQYRD